MNHHFLPTKETADWLHVSPRTLERMRQAGTGPKFRKVGRRIIYAEADVLDWLEAQTFSSTAEADRDVG